VAAVLPPKIDGVRHLDRALQDEALDFFVVFSSLAGVLGNVGQSDYAFANAYLDEFVLARERSRARGRRSGRTLAISWPLWDTGGMRAAAAAESLILGKAGLRPLPPETGLEIFRIALRSGEPQVVAVYGERPRIDQLLVPPAPMVFGRQSSGDPGPDGSLLRASALVYLTERFARLVKIPATRIQAAEPLETYGIDSMMIMEFTGQLEETFGPLSKTLLFEHQTLEQLNEYFVSRHAVR
jgi:hypothetical protein